MNIAKDKVVTLHYTLRDKEGTVLDTSNGDDPLLYIHGNGFLIPGLERELDGKSPGCELKTTVNPEDGYGNYDDSLVFTVSRDEFPKGEEIETGMQFHASSDEGDQVLTVKAVKGDTITLDANHPLAGETLNFEVTVVDVRDATKEELEHGHVHGPHCHH